MQSSSQIIKNDKKKRKRSINTTKDQYEEYLNFMENDYVLQSGTINPSLDPNYINKKWEDLTLKLNGIGNGPQLSIDEWKKRFNDWKNTTRAKYRKIKESALKTGGGEEDNIKLTNLEERGLSVWGKVVCTGSKEVPESGGLQHVSSVKSTEQISETNIDNGDLLITIVDQPIDNNIFYENSNSASNQSNETPNINLLKDNNKSNANKLKETPSLYKRKFKANIKTKPLNETAQNLLKNYEESLSINTTISAHLKFFVENYKEIEAKKLELEKIKLKFEIERYKFENKDFVFEF